MYEKYNQLKNQSTQSNVTNKDKEKEKEKEKEKNIFNYNPNPSYSSYQNPNQFEDSLGSNFKPFNIKKNDLEERDNDFEINGYNKETDDFPVHYSEYDQGNEDKYNLSTKSKNPVNDVNNEDSYIKHLTQFRKFALNEIESTE